MPSLSTLDPDFRPYAEDFFAFAHWVDPRFVVTSARRTWLEQAKLYAAYQFKLDFSQFPGLPAAPPGSSMHELGLAWDMARLGIPSEGDTILHYLGRMWNEIGGFWRPSDPVHFSVEK